MIRRLALALCLISVPAIADEVACPDMTTAVQVGACPTEDELKWGYTGYCGDNARLYDKEAEGDTCVTIENYKKLKDVALWEAGEFQGYLHCSLPAEAHRAAKPAGIGIRKTGKLTRVTCTYDGGQDMTLRIRADCTKSGDKAVCTE
ncbi:MAG: hypothetical protein EPN20_05140 [Magnetospirillum sp.]|nr:MAG: hypothetical protein EPN20_05140 [Magnetospirillum sp.]